MCIKMSRSCELSNEELTIRINHFGAELAAITDTKTGVNYLWNADETFWKRHSPILFPIVGSLKNKEYRYSNQTYTMSQHGFARDMDMLLESESDTEVWYSLRANEDTKVNYPFDFLLEIGYRLQGRTITVMWKVKNLGNDKMYFQIGAHPAFYCPIKQGEERSSYQIDFHTDEQVNYTLISKNGVLERESYSLELEKGLLPITNELFDKDALVLEN
ncbi:MAG TPA: aldose 1-epimerase family protein, partial [Lachnospiraceae bacterium]|nr:aldose 1-epimerase family protein [Lachnospiraceae bacterium]